MRHAPTPGQVTAARLFDAILLPDDATTGITTRVSTVALLRAHVSLVDALDRVAELEAELSRGGA